MIDWLNILYNLVWIVGVAIVMATFSYHDYQAALQELKLRQQLSRRSFQIPFLGGLTLTSLGVALAASIWWERLIWLGIFGLLAVQIWQRQRNRID